MGNTIKILVVEDNPGDLLLLKEIIFDTMFNGSDIAEATNLSEAVNRISEKSYDVIFLDLVLPDSQPEHTISTIFSLNPAGAIIMMTGVDDIHFGEDAVRRGAQDYIVKNQLNPKLLERAICYSVTRKKDKDKLKNLYRLLTSIRAINKLITHEEDRTKLIEKSCEIIVDSNIEYKVWIALTDNNLNLLHYKYKGFNNGIKKFFQGIKSQNHPPCVVEARKQQNNYSTRCINRECASCPLISVLDGKNAYTGMLNHKGNCYGFIGISHPGDLEKNHEELSLFNELKEDLSFALYNIHLQEQEKQLHERISENEKKFRFIAENSIDIIWHMDRRLKFTYLSPSLYDISGYKPEEWVGTHLWEHASRKEFFKMAREAVKMFANFKKEKQATFETKMYGKNKVEIPLEIKIKPLLGDNGELSGLQGTTREIWEREKARSQIEKINQELSNQNEEYVKINKMLKESEKRFQLAMYASTDGIFDWNLSTRSLYCSPGWKKMLGYNEDDLEDDLGLIERMLHPDDKDRVKQLFVHLLAGKTTRVEMDFKMKHKKGYWVDILSRTNSLFDHTGKVVRIIGTHQNITARKKAEQELRDAKTRAEAASKTKDIFLANMSHELRTPLIGVLGYSDLLVTELSDPEHVDMVRSINKGGKRLLDILSSILDLTRVQSGKHDFQIISFDLKSKLNELLELFYGAAEKKNLKLSPVFNHEIFYIETDEHLFFTIITNLLNNAIKFTHEGSIILETRNVQKSGKECISICVSDTGIGIRKDCISQIFDEFRQLSEGTTKEYPGTGLGLSITKKYVEILCGEIHVESKPGKGSKFTVILPVKGKINGE
ncbi:MAG: hypothetical protein SCALA702_04340 [Melioribacteraceae bacterium]|nr:MAG: hypothetical protein SCALA702_04340 [Melioribacteraceae bacterium]